MGWFILKHIFSIILSIINITRLSNQEKDLEILILRLAHENPRSGYGKIQGELIQLSFKVSQSTVRNILDWHGIQPVPVRNSSIGWHHLMTHYKEQILDHILIINAKHLQRVLIEFAQHYNTSRPHQGIDQQMPIPRIILKNTGSIQRRKILGGIINDYFRSSDRYLLSTL